MVDPSICHILLRVILLWWSDKVRINFCCSSRVNHLWFGFGKFPLKIPIFLFFFPSGQKKYLCVGSKSTWVKDESASYLLQVKNILELGQGLRVHLYFDEDLEMVEKLWENFQDFRIEANIFWATNYLLW